MATRLGSVVINCADLELMTAFWAAALDLTPKATRSAYALSDQALTGL